MSARVDCGVVDTGIILARGVVDTVSYGTLKADTATSRDVGFQMHVIRDRAWVRRLIVVDSLTAPELTSLTTRVTTLETNQAPNLTSRVDALEANQVTPHLPVTTFATNYVLTGNKIIPLVEGPGVVINTVTTGMFSPE